MAEDWHTFPAQMGEHRAFITVDGSYAKEADKDPRDILLRVRAAIKKPNPAGMPTDEEFPALSALDEKLDNTFNLNGSRYVGKITVNGNRHFFFYVTCSEETASRAIQRIAKDSAYDLAYVYEKDSGKDGYWKDLYPTPDDWQMIKDLRVLDALRERGDQAEKSREVSHWAYFRDPKAAARFSEWAAENDYKAIKIERSESGEETKVRFKHDGTMVLEDITHRTITLSRQIRELKGDYDGWETSVEKQQV